MGKILFLSVAAATTAITVFFFSFVNLNSVTPKGTSEPAGVVHPTKDLAVHLEKSAGSREKATSTEEKDMQELEKISAELLKFQKTVGDDPTKMTVQELEQQVTLMEAYNRQFKIVIQNTERNM